MTNSTDTRGIYFIDAIARLDEALHKCQQADQALSLAFRAAKALAVTAEQEREIERRRERLRQLACRTDPPQPPVVID